MANTEETSSDGRNTSPSGSETSSTRSFSSHSSHSGDEVEVIASTKDVESDTQPREEPVDTQAKVENKKRRPLVLGLSIGIPLLVIIIIIIVCCVLLIKKKTSAPNITASVEMNGTTRPVKDNDVVNRLPTFSLNSEEIEEDTSCKMENKTSCEGSKGKVE